MIHTHLCTHTHAHIKYPIGNLTGNMVNLGFPGGTSGKEPTCQCRRPEFDWVRKISWRKEWLPTPVFLPRELQGQRSLAGYRPWGHKELDMAEQLTLLLGQTVERATLGIWLGLYQTPNLPQNGLKLSSAECMLAAQNQG